jgi:hypothetical protein
MKELSFCQQKKSENWRIFFRNANQITESAEILDFTTKKIPALPVRSPKETCLELSFCVFPLVLIVGQPKKSGNSKKEQTSVNSSGVN